MPGASNFPNGFPYGVTIRGLPITMTNPGEVFWVNNDTSAVAKGGITGNALGPGTYQKPFDTVDNALNACVANRGDIVVIMPSHNEAESTASTDLFTLDVAGVAVIGLGSGRNRPTFDFDVGSTKITINAANCSISNIICNASVTGVAAGIDVTDVANATLDNIEFIEEGTTDEFTYAIRTGTDDNGNDGLHVTNCYYGGTTGGGSQASFVQLRGDTANVLVANNYFSKGSDTNAFVQANTATDTFVNIRILNNLVYTEQTSGILIFDSSAADNTGIIANNYVGHLDTAGEAIISATSTCRHFENYTASAVNVSGLLNPAAEGAL